MKKRPFVIRMKKEVRHPYPFKRLQASAFPEIWVEHIKELTTFHVAQTYTPVADAQRRKLTIEDLKELKSRFDKINFPKWTEYYFPPHRLVMEVSREDIEKATGRPRINRSPLPLIVDNHLDDDDSKFGPCMGCDLPDACEDFGCAIEQGLREPDDL